MDASRPGVEGAELGQGDVQRPPLGGTVRAELGADEQHLSLPSTTSGEPLTVCGDVTMPLVGAATRVEIGTDCSLASVAAGIGAPAGGDAWLTEPQPEPPPATFTITSTATTTTTSAMVTIP